MPRRDETATAALLDGVGPAVDAGDMHATNLSDRGVTPALLDDSGGDVRHGDKLRSSQRSVKRRNAKIATDAVCEVRKIGGMDDGPFSKTWFDAQFARTGLKQADLVRFFQERGANIDASKISKTVNSGRAAKIEEQIAIYEFFSLPLDDLVEQRRAVWRSSGVKNLRESEREQLKRAGADVSGGLLQFKSSAPPNAGLPESLRPHLSTSVDLMPILGRSVGGSSKSAIQFNGQALGHVARPASLANNPRAYAAYVHGESMEPRYEAGEIVLVNPDKGYRKGNYVVAQIYDNEGDPPFGYVKRFISFGEELVLEQLNPPEGEERLMRFPRDRVVAVHRIVGTLDE